jgi:hypothetical protein
MSQQMNFYQERPPFGMMSYTPYTSLLKTFIRQRRQRQVELEVEVKALCREGEDRHLKRIDRDQSRRQ